MKFLKTIMLCLAVLSVIVIVVYFGVFSTSQNIPIQKDVVQKNLSNLENTKLIKWSSGSLFDIFVDPKDIVTINGKQIPMKARFELKPDLSDTYSEIGVYNKKIKPLFIIPVFTASAYLKNGFYDFYNGRCDTCLTIKITSLDELGE